MTNESKTVFISYAKEDIAEAKLIFELINENTDFNAWLDEEFLLPGMDWELAIMKALQDSKLIVLIISQNSVTKTGFVQKEIKKALDRLDYFPSTEIYIIPVLIEKCLISEPRLMKIQYLKLYENRKQEEVKLIKTLELVSSKNKGSKDKLNTKLFIPLKEQHKLTDSELKSILKESRNLARRNCMDFDFENMDLRNVTFRGANLVGANFRNANLELTDFSFSNLERADLTWANLAYSNFIAANLWGGRLAHAKNINKVLSCEFINLFHVRDCASEELQFEKKTRNILYLPDYGSYREYFKDKFDLNEIEYMEQFNWMKDEYFLNMFRK